MYTPTNWKNGDIITEQKLNKLEQGLEDAGCKIVVINVTLTAVGTDYTCAPDKTFAEVMALIEDGYIPVYLFTEGDVHNVALPNLVCTDSSDSGYGITINVSDSTYVHNTGGMSKTSSGLQ